MKTSGQSISTRIALSDTSTAGKHHPPLFDEVAIVLPDAIKQPTLKRLASKIQQLQVSANTPKVASEKIVNESRIKDKVNKEGINEQSADYQSTDYESTDYESTDNSDRKEIIPVVAIRQAHAILQDLYDTPSADAAVLVAITNEPQPKLLLTRRANHLNSHAGEVSFAGGKHDSGDGNNVVTALREALEETALPPSKVHIIGQLPVQTSKFGMSVRPIVALIDPDVIYTPELGEIARIFWADFEAIISQPTVDYERVYLHSSDQDAKRTKYLTPSWLVDDERVWGLTGRIIADLLEVAFERQIEWYYRPID